MCFFRSVQLTPEGELDQVNKFNIDLMVSCASSSCFLCRSLFFLSCGTVPPHLFHTNINYFRGTVEKKNSEGGSAKCETNKIN